MAIYGLGQRVGNWTVTALNVRKVFGPGTSVCAVAVRCDCGTERVLPASSLSQGTTLSCGCGRGRRISKNRAIHAGSGTRLYRTWRSMRARCALPSQDKRGNYLGKGITVCAEWQASFEAFRTWALANGYDDSLTIDRIDGNGPYSPANCRFVTARVQANNIRTNRHIEMLGERKTLAEWGRDPRCAVPPVLFKSRVGRGWDPLSAFSRPRDPRGARS